ncbi:MAG: NTP transferase domain-containing protein [Candidatus Ornithospirochaeta sp.]
MTTIILAAGLSERMGRNKLLLPFGGRSIISITVEKALDISDRVVVVTGNEKEKIEDALSSFPIDFVFNPEYREGQRKSTLVGIESVRDDDFSILPGDLPLFQKEDAVAAFKALLHSTTSRCVHSSVPGHPVAYRKENRERILSYPGTMKKYLEEAGCFTVPASIGSVFDLDTPERYRLLLEADGDLGVLDAHIDLSVTRH